MAKELAPFNIRCNSISPGLTNTEMLNKFTSKENQKNKLDKSILKELPTRGNCRCDFIFSFKKIIIYYW